MQTIQYFGFYSGPGACEGQSEPKSTFEEALAYCQRNFKHGYRCVIRWGGKKPNGAWQHEKFVTDDCVSAKNEIRKFTLTATALQDGSRHNQERYSILDGEYFDLSDLGVPDDSPESVRSVLREYVSNRDSCEINPSEGYPYQGGLRIGDEVYDLVELITA